MNGMYFQIRLPRKYLKKGEKKKNIKLCKYAIYKENPKQIYFLFIWAGLSPTLLNNWS